jgi:hypothetical protein
MMARDILKMAAHRFAIGQTVRFKGSFGMSLQAAEIYRITGKLPDKDNSPQYRIRNDDERHERVTTEDSLEDIEAKPFRSGVIPK